MDHLEGGGRLLEFDAEVFGAEGIARLRDEDGTIEHAEFRIGDSIGLYSYGVRRERGMAGHAGFLPVVCRERGDAVYRRALEAVGGM